MTLNQDQMDVLTEIINIGVGKSASLLSDILNTAITLSIPAIKIKTLGEMRRDFRNGAMHKYTVIKLDFDGPFSGIAQVVFPTESAASLVSLLTDAEPDSMELDSLSAGTLSEIANIVLNGVMGSIANILGSSFQYHLPVYSEGGPDIFLHDDLGDDAVLLISETDFQAKKYNIEGEFVLLLELAAFGELKNRLDKLVNES